MKTILSSIIYNLDVLNLNKENSNPKKNIWVLAKILSGHMISKSIPELPRPVGLEKYRLGIHTPAPVVTRSKWPSDGT